MIMIANIIYINYVTITNFQIDRRSFSSCNVIAVDFISNFERGGILPVLRLLHVTMPSLMYSTTYTNQI